PDRNHLLLAARGKTAAGFAPVLEAWKPVVDTLKIVCERTAARPAQETAGQEILLDRELGKDMAALEHLDDALGDEVGGMKMPRRLAAPGDRTAAQRAAFRGQQVGDSLERRRLPGAVGAE